MSHAPAPNMNLKNNPSQHAVRASCKAQRHPSQRVIVRLQFHSNGHRKTARFYATTVNRRQLRVRMEARSFPSLPTATFQHKKPVNNNSPLAAFSWKSPEPKGVASAFGR